MRTWISPSLTMLLLAACATAPVEVRREAAGSPEQVTERIAARLTALGLQVSGRSATGLTATSQSASPDWARCLPRRVSSGDDRRLMATARTRRATIHVGLTPVDGRTAVEVRAEFEASYNNPTRAETFSAACESTGVIEAAVLEAAGS